MERIELRKFANMTCLEMIVFCEVRREITVVDDLKEEVVTDTMLLGMNWFGLITHRHFNEEPYLIEEVIDLSGNNGYPTFIDDKLLTKPLNKFMARIMLKHNDPDFYDLIKQFNFVHQNLLHNYLSIIGQRGVISARAVDVKEIYDHPLIRQIKQDRLDNKITSLEARARFNRVLLTDPDFDKSVFALFYRTKAVDKTQSYQLIIERERVFDLNNTILPFNIYDSYADGIINLADSLADSRTGGFALVSNGAALQDSEWFHMKIHNLANIIKTVDYQKDCGSTKGTIVKVISEDFRHNLQGKYYFKEDGSLELIHEGTIKNIEIGSTIKYRSVAWCNQANRENQGKPCAVCFGRMDSVIPYNPFMKRSAVPGMFFGSNFGEKTSQATMKSKHRIDGAIAVEFVVNKKDSKYIWTNDQYIYFQPDFLKEENEPYLFLDKEITTDFADYLAMENIDDLNSSHLPTREVIQLSLKMANPMYDGGFGTETPIVTTSVGPRRARMTKDFIRYIKDSKMEEDYKANKISLKDWDPEKPAYELPFINENLDAYRKRVEDFLKFNHLKSRIAEPVDEVFHGDQILEFWKVVHEQNKDANIIIHDIFLYCCMVRNLDNLDYSTPNANEERYFMSFHECILNRGQGNALMYGWQGKQLTGSPLNFLIKNRQSGVMESFLAPITF